MKKENYKIQQLKLIANIGDVSSTLSIADGGEIAFLPPGQPLPIFDLKMEVNNKKPNY